MSFYAYSFSMIFDVFLNITICSLSFLKFIVYSTKKECKLTSLLGIILRGRAFGIRGGVFFDHHRFNNFLLTFVGDE